jgi:hypothetical protein
VGQLRWINIMEIYSQAGLGMAWIGRGYVREG